MAALRGTQWLMCTRYTLVPEEIRRQPVPADMRLPDDLEPRYNIAPQQFACVARRTDGQTRLNNLQWGYLPGWLDPARAQPNLRAESVFGTLMYDEAAKHTRCIVPASGWYEWPDRGRGTHPRYYHRSQGGLIGLAGLWTRNYSERLDTFAIVTTAVNPTSTFIHNRTPVVLREESYGLWLDSTVSDEKSLSPALSFYEPADLVHYRVGHYIDDAAYDSPNCLERVD